MDTEAWEKAGQAVRQRRIELHMTQEELARKADVSLRTVGNIETGRPMTRLSPSLVRIEVALGWESDSFRGMLAGQPPVVRSTDHVPLRYVASSHTRSSQVVDPGEADLSSVSFEQLKAEYDRRIEEMVRKAVAANPDAQ